MVRILQMVSVGGILQIPIFYRCDIEMQIFIAALGTLPNLVGTML